MRFVQQIVLKQTPYRMSIQTATTQNQTQKTQDFRQKYKTEKCRFWYERGFCPFNKFCAFAHNEEEIREKQAFNFKYKTKLCHNFFQYGFCKYGDRCQYIHKSFRTQKDGNETRSNSEESYSSKSSSQKKSSQPSIQQKPFEFKHQARYEVMKEKDFSLFEIIMGRQVWMKELIEGEMTKQLRENESQQICNDVRHQGSLGSCQQKKYRMYSM